jgi:hypothetical protein
VSDKAAFIVSRKTNVDAVEEGDYVQEKIRG